MRKQEKNERKRKNETENLNSLFVRHHLISRATCAAFSRASFRYHPLFARALEALSESIEISELQNVIPPGFCFFLGPGRADVVGELREEQSISEFLRESCSMSERRRINSAQGSGESSSGFRSNLHCADRAQICTCDFEFGTDFGESCNVYPPNSKILKLSHLILVSCVETEFELRDQLCQRLSSDLLLAKNAGCISKLACERGEKRERLPHTQIHT